MYMKLDVEVIIQCSVIIQFSVIIQCSVIPRLTSFRTTVGDANKKHVQKVGVL
jgi:hypothetical protein